MTSEEERKFEEARLKLEQNEEARLKLQIKVGLVSAIFFGVLVTLAFLAAAWFEDYRTRFVGTAFTLCIPAVAGGICAGISYDLLGDLHKRHQPSRRYGGTYYV